MCGGRSWRRVWQAWISPRARAASVTPAGAVSPVTLAAQVFQRGVDAQRDGLPAFRRGRRGEGESRSRTKQRLEIRTGFTERGVRNNDRLRGKHKPAVRAVDPERLGDQRQRTFLRGGTDRFNQKKQ